MKLSLLALSLALVVAPLHAADAAPSTVAAPPPADINARIEALLGQLTLDEKIELLGGDETGFNSKGVPRLGIPPIRMTDGPVGVRDGTPSNAYPVSINMAATWDADLIHRYGIALGEDTLAHGKNAILGPCVGIGRFPLGGRNFEAFGEDPYLSSRMAVSVIEGVQSQHVIATVKHFACNDQEWERNNYDVEVDERTLHEVHLRPFEAAVKEGKVWMLMSSYNRVNGQHMSENAPLLKDVLKGQWGYQGLVVSDWVSVYSSADAANNGLDIEMPQAVFLGDKLREDVKAGRVPMSVIDDKVRRHLRVRYLAGIFDHPAPKRDESRIRSQAHRDLALEIAQKSIVLLKNDGVLPLAAAKLTSVALVGPHAEIARSGGGGSSQVEPWITVSPVQGFKERLPATVKVTSSPGISMDSFKPDPLPVGFLHTSDGKDGLVGEYFDNRNQEGKPKFTRVDKTIDFDWGSSGPGGDISANNYSVRWTGTFTAKETKTYSLAITSDDGSYLYIDDKLVADNGGNHGEITVPASVPMEAGKSYRIRIDYDQAGGGAAMRLGWRSPSDTRKDPSIDDAVETARQAALAIVCVGNAPITESEGGDVADFKLPGKQEELLTRVLDANPNTIVVVYGGVPVEMKPWLSRARAVIAALYPGQEGGAALASLVLGEKSFSGKLPFSYIQDRTENPAFAGYKDPSLKVPYSEGVFVGYKWYDRHNVTPLFPFGFGLSYTTFTYSDLSVTRRADARWVATVSVKNTGNRAGDEIVQIYVEPKQSHLPRPIRELKGFGRVSLKPGETRTLTIPLDERAFSYYDPAQHDWVTEPGTYLVSAAANSRDLRVSTSVTLR